MDGSESDRGADDGRSGSNELLGRSLFVDAVYGFLAGVLAVAVGFTAVVLFSDASADADAIEGELPEDDLFGVSVSEFLPEWYQVLGWEFLANHHVDISAEIGPALENGAFVAEYVDTLLPTASVLRVIPPILLALAGLAVAARTPREGVLEAAGAGATVVVGYLPAVAVVLSLASFEVRLPVVGVVLLEIAPDLVAGVVIAGVAYPLFFGALGGALWALATWQR